MCKHDINALQVTPKGIVCKKCGKLFPSLATLHADLEADRAGQTAPAPVQEPAEPKKRAARKKAQ
jgi:hypothetical protein